MRVRQRIIVTLLILAMGTMNVGTLSVYAAETENQNVIKEEKTKPESEEKDEEKPVQKTEADESTVDGSIEGGSMEDEPVVDESTEDESTTDEATGENPETIPEEKTTEIAPEQQGEKQDDKKEVELASGVYKIQLEANKNYVLDVAGGSTANEANVQIYVNNETDAQKWYITKAEDGWYRIKNVQSGKLLSSKSKEAKIGENINQNQQQESFGQRYKFYETGSGSCYITTESGTVLDVSAGRIANSSNVQLYGLNKTVAQKWCFAKARSTFGEDAEKQIADGYYTINMKTAGNLGFDVANYSNANGGNVQLWGQTPNAAQIFYISKNKDGWYTIKNFASGKVLDVSAGKNANGTNIQQWDANGTAAQKFKFYEDEQGRIRILSAIGSRKVLDISAGKLKNGGNVQIYTYNGSNAQNFVIKSWKAPGNYKAIQAGNYRLYPAAASGLSIDVQGASNSDGGNVQIYSTNGTGAQEWKIIPNGEWYYLKNVNSGKVLDVKNGSGASGVNLQQWSTNGGAGQLFRFYENGNGRYYIMAKTGRVIDCAGGSLKSGTNLQIYAFNGTAAQQWMVEKVVLSVSQIANIADGYYLFKSGDLCMEVTDASKDNQANVGLGTANEGEHQIFKITNKRNNWYEVENLNSGKVLDVTNGSNADKTNLQQVDANGSMAQRFRFYSAGTGNYYLKSQLGTMITADKENANIYLGNAVLSNEQKWQMKRVIPKGVEISVSNGNYRIFSSLANRMVLDISNGSRNNGANVQIWSDNGTMAQSFYISKESDGWYSIKNNSSGKYLDVDNGNAASGTNLKQWQKNGSSAQKFKFYDAGDSKIMIRSKLGTYIDVSGGNCYNGANVWLYQENESNAQVWSLKKAYTKQTLDSTLGVSGRTIQEELAAHVNDRYYLGTHYCGEYTIPDRCMHPNGSPGYNNYTGLNCTGFIAFVVGKCGGDLGMIARMGRNGGYTNGSNWYKYLKSVNVECYAYNSIAELLRNGRAEKGDIMYKEPKNWNCGEDCHLAFFWGDTAWDNKFWHSLEDGNQISPLQVENYANTYYLIKTRK